MKKVLFKRLHFEKWEGKKFVGIFMRAKISYNHCFHFWCQFNSSSCPSTNLREKPFLFFPHFLFSFCLIFLLKRAFYLRFAHCLIQQVFKVNFVYEHSACCISINTILKVIRRILAFNSVLHNR